MRWNWATGCSYIRSADAERLDAKGFRLRNVPLLSRVGADRADTLRTDVDAAVAGWRDALLLRVDRRNQVLISDGRVVLVRRPSWATQPPQNAVFLGRLEDGRHVWAIRGALEPPEDPRAEPRCSTCAGPARSSTMSARSWCPPPPRC